MFLNTDDLITDYRISILLRATRQASTVTLTVDGGGGDDESSVLRVFRAIDVFIFIHFEHKRAYTLNAHTKSGCGVSPVDSSVEYPYAFV